MINVQDLTERLAAHPLYPAISSDQTLQVFMRSHVFCVWDFMSLLKTLQRELTGVDVPWFPKGDREARRFINDIVLAEESDLHPSGGYASHFELYYEAMRACRADCAPIDRFLERLRTGRHLDAALAGTEIPDGVREFVRTTFSFIDSAELHRIAAAFAYGREDVIPEMFRRLVQELAQHAPQHWSGLLYYLKRHIEVDGDHHGPLAQRLLARLCGDDASKWREAEAAARQALEARLRLWDAVLMEITGASEQSPRWAAG